MLAGSHGEEGARRGYPAQSADGSNAVLGCVFSLWQRVRSEIPEDQYIQDVLSPQNMGFVIELT